MDDSVPDKQESRVSNNGGLAQKLDAAGWGLFFIWVGAVLLMDLGWGVGLIGVAAITLGEQAARRYFGIGVQAFWVVVGLVFLVGGVWELYKVEISLVPILLIIAGVALLVSIFSGHRHSTQ